MMYMYHSSCRDSNFSLTDGTLTTCPFCMNEPVEVINEFDEGHVEAALVAIAKAAELHDVCVVNKVPEQVTDLWFLLYIDKIGKRVCGYAQSHELAIQLALMLGFSGKKDRLIANWGQRPLCGDDFKALFGN